MDAPSERRAFVTQEATIESGVAAPITHEIRA
jgi:hypothetical protein